MNKKYRCYATFSDNFVTNLQLNLLVKKVKIGQQMAKLQAKV